MSEHPSTADESLPPELGHQVDRACDRFEAAWQAARAGDRPRLEDYLAAAPEPLRSALLRELLALELAYRKKNGERPEPADYADRFPNHVQVIRNAFGEDAPPEVATDPSVPTSPRSTRPDRPGTASFPTGDGKATTPAPGGRGDVGTGGPAFGDYELLDTLGTGGMGVVYRARQRGVNRLVAVKVLGSAHLDDLSPERARPWHERFRAEAQAVGRLEHEHIVPVIAAGEEGGRLYYAMRLVEGPSLADLIRNGPLPGPRAAAYLEPVARAIHHAHSRGIIHRDVKPANVLVDAGDRPLVADFGLSKWLEGGPSLTQTGHCLGSPPYMSPAQVQDSARVTPASDVYSLGATLYDLVTGRPPFQAATVLETFRLVFQQDPVPPRDLNPGIDRDLQTIVLHCLHKEPGRRYATAEALADDLRRYLNGEPIRARPVGRAERLWRWCRRNPVVAGLAAAVLLLAAAVTTAVGVGYVSTTRARREVQNRTPPERSALALSPDERWLAFGLDDPVAPYLVDLHHPEAEPLPLAGRGASTLAFVPSGDRLWGTSAEQTVWDLPARRAQREPRERWLAAAFNARGERIGARLEETLHLKVLDVSTGQDLPLMADEPAVADLPSPVGFSPDGKQLLTALQDAPGPGLRLRTWDVASGRRLHERKGGTGRFFFQGPRALELDDQFLLTVRDLEQDQPMPSILPASPGPQPFRNYPFPSRFTFSGDGRLAAETGMAGEIAIWDFADPKRKQHAQVKRASRKPGLADGRDPKAFSPDGSRLAAFDGTNRLKVWDTREGKVLGELPLKDRPELFAFDAAGRDLLLVYLGRGLEAWRPGEAGTRRLGPLDADALREEERKQFWGPEELRIQDALRITEDRKRLVYASRVDPDGFCTVYVWQLPGGQPTRHRVSLPPGGWPRLAVNADGSKVALLAPTARLRVCNLAAGTAVLTLPWTGLEEGNREAPRARLRQALRFSPDGAYCALLDDLRRPLAVRLFDLAAGAEVSTIVLPHLGSCLALTGGARLLAVAQDRRVFVFDPQARKRIAILPDPRAAVTDLALDEQTGLLAAASAEDGTVRLWRLPAGELLATLATGQDALQRVALSPTGRWLATLDRRGRVRLWDLAEARSRLREVGLDW
jgi:WD40 repeat protein